jgi:hypothetical protein
VQAADPGEYRQLIDIVPSTDEQRLLLGTPTDRPLCSGVHLSLALIDACVCIDFRVCRQAV